MTSEKLHDALNLLPADLVVETDALRTQAKKPQVHWQRWAAMAACLAVVLLAGTMFSYFFGHMGSSKTAAAVKDFQRKNGLAADGVVGSATLAALGMQDSAPSGGSAAQSGSVDLLARVISAEARGEPYSGQVAVGAVILNRVGHPSFPNTIAGVVYQPGAFSCMLDGQFDQPVADSAVRAARDAMNGADPSGGAIYYFNPNTATSAWIWSRPLIKIIGKHRFCS